MERNAYPAFARRILNATAVPALVVKTWAVVLERIAMGAGETNWYYCESLSQLTQIVQQFRPGSCVSFYFDQRIRKLQLDAGTWKIVEELLRDEIDVVVGALCSDGFTIEVEFVAGYGDFEGFLDRGVQPGHTIFIGRFPARANDSGAVTLVLPDLDDVTRLHPY